MNYEANRPLLGLLLHPLLLTGCGDGPEIDRREAVQEPDGDPQPSLAQRAGTHFQDFRENYLEKYRTGRSRKNMAKRLPPDDTLPDPEREFRATWVATVHNLDWPSRPGLPTEQVKAEARSILDQCVELNMNAVIFQVRPQADAFYRSKLEPWSYYLTGQQGKAPDDPGFDPLAFWIDESHARGLQLHAWFNPYRAYHGTRHGPMCDRFIVNSRPDLVVKLKRPGYWWLNPASREAREHTLDVVMDVVKRYDIDGVHFDDYFYPYPAYNGNRSFPDAEAFSAYEKSGGKLSLADWRREGVNRLIEELYGRIQNEKQHVEFGISPFGIWRPGHSKGIEGLDQYRVLFADTRLWFNQGWVDYLMPQLYWPIDSKKQSFPVLLEWWHEQNLQDRHLWPGMRLKCSTELVNQIEVTRKSQDCRSGMCLFSVTSLLRKSKGHASALIEGPWSEKALIPPSPWKRKTTPPPPELIWIEETGDEASIGIHIRAEETFQIAINEKKDDQWSAPTIHPANYREHPIKEDVQAVAVRSVDRVRQTSEAMVLERDNLEFDPK